MRKIRMLLKYFSSFILFVICLTIYSCGNNSIEEISVHELKKEIEENPSLIIIDVRTEAELTGPLDRIENSVHIPINELKDRIIEIEIYRDKEICVICRVGVRSARGTEILTNHGFNVRNVAGGMTEFRNAKY